MLANLWQFFIFSTPTLPNFHSTVCQQHVHTARFGRNAVLLLISICVNINAKYARTRGEDLSQLMTKCLAIRRIKAQSLAVSFGFGFGYRTVHKPAATNHCVWKAAPTTIKCARLDPNACFYAKIIRSHILPAQVSFSNIYINICMNFYSRNSVQATEQYALAEFVDLGNFLLMLFI